MPRQFSVDLTGLRSVVCGVRDLHDTMSVAAAGALADALDLQLVLVHVWDEPDAHMPRALAFPPGTFDADRPPDQVAVRALLADVARRAGRWAPGHGRRAMHREADGKRLPARSVLALAAL